MLRCVAKILHESTRDDDLTARYGGEEFVALLGGAPEDVQAVAEHINSGIEPCCTPELESLLFRKVTVSAAVAILGAGMRSLEGLVEAADKEM